MKLTQKACNIRLPSTKSANALSELIFGIGVPSSSFSTYPSSLNFVAAFFAAADAVGGGRSAVCIRNEAVRTN